MSPLFHNCKIKSKLLESLLSSKNGVTILRSPSKEEYIGHKKWKRATEYLYVIRSITQSVSITLSSYITTKFVSNESFNLGLSCTEYVTS